MPSFSRPLEESLHRAVAYANQRKHEYATLEHLLLSLTDDDDAAGVMRACDVDLVALKKSLANYLDVELASLVVDDEDDAKPTAGFQRVIQRAVIHVQSSGREEVTGANVLVAIFSERESHAAYFLALAEEAEPHLEKNPEKWPERLETEHDNLRAALEWLQTSGESQLALRLAGALASFWEGAHLTEGRRWLESLLPGDEHQTAARAKALAGAALMARQSGDAETARLRAEEALALHRELGNVWGTANAGVMLGLAVADEGDFARARQLFDDSTQLFRDVGDEGNALFATRLLGWMYEELGDHERARAVHEDNLGRARVLGNKQIEAQTLGALAYFALEQGRARDAVSMMKDVLRIDRDRGVRLQTTFDLTRFARALAFAGGAGADAVRLLSSAEAVRNEMMGAGVPPFLATIIEEALAAIHVRLDDPAFAEAAWVANSFIRVRMSPTLRARSRACRRIDGEPGTAELPATSLPIP